jgi:hypothetical protein
MVSTIAYQDVEKVLQLCSRVAQKLNVRKKVRFASSLAAASLEGLFEHPAESFSPPETIEQLAFNSVQYIFSTTC